LNDPLSLETLMETVPLAQELVDAYYGAAAPNVAALVADAQGGWGYTGRLARALVDDGWAD